METGTGVLIGSAASGALSVCIKLIYSSRVGSLCSQFLSPLNGLFVRFHLISLATCTHCAVVYLIRLSLLLLLDL